MAETTTFGGSTLPLPATPAGRIRDPIGHMLLDYIGWYFNKVLNPQFALLYPSTPNAVPTTQRFGYDPKDVWAQNGAQPTPALYIYWKSGTSQAWSIVKDRAVDTYEMTWLAPSRNEPDGARSTSGLLAVAQRALRLAADRGWHPEYSYDGAPLGEPPHITIGIQGWELREATVGQYRPAPSRAPGARVDYYPTLKATIRTYAIIEPPTPQDPAEALGDSTFAVYTNEQGDIHDTVLFSQATLPAPDGSEDGDE